MKYKLKIKYPDCPFEINSIVEKQTEGFLKDMYCLVDGTKHVRVLKESVENYPEIWEKVEELDYEILSFVDSKNPNKIFYKNKENKYVNDIYTLIEEHGYSINSIKRISDNIEFSIGDIVQLNDVWEESCSIKEINIYNDEVSFTILDNNCVGAYKRFQDFKKVEKPLFTTNDGIKIFEGNTIYSVTDNFELLKTDFATIKDLGIRCFSSKEAAEIYIIENKPYLSFSDLKIINQESMFLRNFIIFPENQLKELIKTKL